MSEVSNRAGFTIDWWWTQPIPMDAEGFGWREGKAVACHTRSINGLGYLGARRFPTFVGYFVGSFVD